MVQSVMRTKTGKVIELKVTVAEIWEGYDSDYGHFLYLIEDKMIINLREIEYIRDCKSN